MKLDDPTMTTTITIFKFKLLPISKKPNDDIIFCCCSNRLEKLGQYFSFFPLKPNLFLNTIERG